MEWNPLNWGKQNIQQSNYQLQDQDYMRGVAQQGIANSGQVVPIVNATHLHGADQRQARQQQYDLMQRLQGIASGTQQGAGELASQRQTNQAIAQQQAAARMARGANSVGGAGLAAGRNMASLGVQGAGMAQQAAMQDQMNANGLMGQVAGQMRGQDLDFAGQNAQLRQQGRLANQQATLQNRAQNDAAALAYLQQLYGMNMGQAQLNQAYDQAQANNKGIFGDLLQAGAGMGAAYLGAKGGK